MADSALGISELTVGVFGVLLAITFFVLARRSKEPRWGVQTATLIDHHLSQVDGLEIAFKGQPVLESLSVSRVLFYNRGRMAIRSEDIVNPVTIQGTGDTKVLDATLVTANHGPNNIRVVCDTNANGARIDFEYLGQRHGCVIRVLHTGAGSKSVTLSGDLVEADSIKFIELYPEGPLWAFFAAVMEEGSTPQAAIVRWRKAHIPKPLRAAFLETPYK
jgi:hypothetical protein